MIIKDEIRKLDIESHKYNVIADVLNDLNQKIFLFSHFIDTYENQDAYASTISQYETRIKVTNLVASFLAGYRKYDGKTDTYEFKSELYSACAQVEKDLNERIEVLVSENKGYAEDTNMKWIFDENEKKIQAIKEVIKLLKSKV